jgi:hypothetical protein
MYEHEKTLKTEMIELGNIYAINKTYNQQFWIQI